MVVLTFRQALLQLPPTLMALPAVWGAIVIAPPPPMAALITVASPTSIRALLVVTAPASVMPPVLLSVKGSLKLAAFTVIAPLMVVAPMVIRLKPSASAARSVADKSSAAVPSAPPSVIASVLVSGNSVSALLPLTVFAPPLKAISSALIVSALAPAATLLLKVTVLPASVRPPESVTTPV